MGDYKDSEKEKSDVEEEFTDSEDDSSEWESGSDCDGSESSSTEEESEEDIHKPNRARSKVCVLDSDTSNSSDSDDPDTPQCPICLLRIRRQDVGTPESCDHNFCLECIQEWAKNMNCCPMDRLVFKLIFARHTLGGPIYEKIEVANREIADEDPNEIAQGCEICGRPDNEEWMLLCDGCDLGFHCQCLVPALTSIPIGEWFCNNCRPESEEEVSPGPSTVRQRRRRHNERRLIGRTRVSERVRAVIANVRALRGRQIIMSDTTESESEYEEDFSNMDLALAGTVEFDPNNPPTSSNTTSSRIGVKRKRKSRRKHVKRRKTSKKSSTRAVMAQTSKNGKYRLKTKRKSKRRSKRKSKRCKSRKLARTKRHAPTTSKMRIADALGLKSPPVGSTIPRIRSSRSEQLNSFFSNQESILSLRGEGNDLLMLNDSDGEGGTFNGDSHGIGNVAVIRSAADAMANAIAVHHRTKNKIVSQSVSKVSSQSSSVDLLGDILNSQTMLQDFGNDRGSPETTKILKTIENKNKNNHNGRQCGAYGNGEQGNHDSTNEYTGPPTDSGTNPEHTGNQETQVVNSNSHGQENNVAKGGNDEEGSDGQDNAQFSPVESSDDDDDQEEEKDKDNGSKSQGNSKTNCTNDSNDASMEEKECSDGQMLDNKDATDDADQDTTANTVRAFEENVERFMQEEANKHLQAQINNSPQKESSDYNPFSPTGGSSQQEGSQSDAGSNKSPKEDRDFHSDSKESSVSGSPMRPYTDSDSDSVASKKAASDEFSDSDYDKTRDTLNNSGSRDEADISNYFTVQSTNQNEAEVTSSSADVVSHIPTPRESSEQRFYDSGDETPTEDEVPLPTTSGDNIIVPVPIPGTLGRLAGEGGLSSALNIPLPSTSTIPLPDADDADIIPLPDSDIPRMPGGTRVVRSTCRNPVIPPSEPIVLEDNETSLPAASAERDVLDLTGPEPFINITPGVIEIIPIEDDVTPAPNSSGRIVTVVNLEDNNPTPEETPTSSPSRIDAFQRLGPPVASESIAVQEQQALLFERSSRRLSLELEDGEQRSDVESPLQVIPPTSDIKKTKKRRKKKHLRRHSDVDEQLTPNDETDYDLPVSSKRKDKKKERSIERDRERERKKRKKEREREVRAEWGEYEQVSADDFDINVISSKKKKNKKDKRGDAEKENWMLEVDRYEEYRNRQKQKQIDKEYDAREYANKIYKYDNGGEWVADKNEGGRQSDRKRKKRQKEQGLSRDRSLHKSRDTHHKSRRSRSRRSRSRSNRRRDRSRKSYSRSRSRGRSRSARGRSPDRHRSRHSPRRRERTRSRDRNIRNRSKSRDRDGKGHRHRSEPSPDTRKHSRRNRSRSKTPKKDKHRSKHRSKSPKRDKEYYRQRDREDYRGSLQLFTQSLREVTEPQKASNRKVKMSKRYPDRLEVDVEQSIDVSDGRRRRKYSTEPEPSDIEADEVTIVSVKEAPSRKKKKKHSKSNATSNNQQKSPEPQPNKTTTSLAASLSRSGRSRAHVESSPEISRPLLTDEIDELPRRGFQPLDLPSRNLQISNKTPSPPAMSPMSDTYDPSKPTDEPSPIIVSSPKRPSPRKKRQRKSNVDDIFHNLTPPSSGSEDDMASRKTDKPLQPLLPPILQEEILMRHHRPLDSGHSSSSQVLNTSTLSSAPTVNANSFAGAATLGGGISGAQHRLPQFIPHVPHHPPPARIGWPLSRPDNPLVSPPNTTLGTAAATNGLPNVPPTAQSNTALELLSPMAAAVMAKTSPAKISTDTPVLGVADKSPLLLAGAPLTAAPPAIPPKALKEMEQISQLLNAQAKLSSLLSTVHPEKKSASANITTPVKKSKLKDRLDDSVLNAASPRSDDDIGLSFSPPPFSPLHRRTASKTPVKAQRPPAASGAETGKEEEISSAVALDHKEKYMKKLNRQERVIEEVKLAVKPFYARSVINKEEYKDIMRKSVPKICHSKSGEINSAKIRTLIEAYVDKVTRSRKPSRRKKHSKTLGTDIFNKKKQPATAQNTSSTVK